MADRAYGWCVSKEEDKVESSGSEEGSISFGDVESAVSASEEDDDEIVGFAVGESFCVDVLESMEGCGYSVSEDG